MDRFIFLFSCFLLLFLVSSCSKEREAMEKEAKNSHYFFFMLREKSPWSYSSTANNLFMDPPKHRESFSPNGEGDFQLKGVQGTEYSFEYIKILVDNASNKDLKLSIIYLYTCTWMHNGTQQKQFCAIENSGKTVLTISNQFYKDQSALETAYFDNGKWNNDKWNSMEFAIHFPLG